MGVFVDGPVILGIPMAQKIPPPGFLEATFPRLWCAVVSFSLFLEWYTFLFQYKCGAEEWIYGWEKEVGMLLEFM